MVHYTSHFMNLRINFSFRILVLVITIWVEGSGGGAIWDQVSCSLRQTFVACGSGSRNMYKLFRVGHFHNAPLCFAPLSIDETHTLSWPTLYILEFYYAN